jgi:hypothetical protein
MALGLARANPEAVIPSNSRCGIPCSRKFAKLAEGETILPGIIESG